MTTPRILTVPGAVPFVEVGVGDARVPIASPARWDVSKWDEVGAVWAGTEPAWLDVSCDVHAVDSYRGHDRTTDRWDVGTCTVTVSNASGWADPSTTPRTPGLQTLRPGRALRWGVSIDGGPRVVVWRGVIDRHDATYAGRLADTDSATLGAVDMLGDAGSATVPRVDPAVGANETCTARLHRILDALGVDPASRRIDTNATPMVATVLGAAGLDLLTVTAESVGGAIYGDTDGTVVFRQRDWQYWHPATPPNATIGNVTGGVCPSSWEVTFDRGDLITRAVVGAAGAVPIVVNDTAAQTLYGYETGPERTDLVTVDTGTLTMVANRLIAAGGAATMPRIRAVTLDAATSLEARNLAATVNPTGPSRYRVVLERAGRTVWDRQMFATSVTHTWDAAGWHVRIGLDDAAPWQAIGGRWDSAVWDGALWNTSAAELEGATA